MSGCVLVACAYWCTPGVWTYFWVDIGDGFDIFWQFVESDSKVPDLIFTFNISFTLANSIVTGSELPTDTDPHFPILCT